MADPIFEANVSERLASLRMLVPLFGLFVSGVIVYVFLASSGIEAASGQPVTWGVVSFDVPPGSVVETQGPGGLIVLVNPEERGPRRIKLSPWTGAKDDWEDEARLLPDGWAGWKTSTWEGGSGGVEAEACGRVTQNDVDLAFCCTDQDELAPDVRWCLPWLASLARQEAE